MATVQLPIGISTSSTDLTWPSSTGQSTMTALGPILFSLPSANEKISSVRAIVWHTDLSSTLRDPPVKNSSYFPFKDVRALLFQRLSVFTPRHNSRQRTERRRVQDGRRQRWPCLVAEEEDLEGRT